MLYNIINDFFSGIIMVITPIIFGGIILDSKPKLQSKKSFLVIAISLILCYLSKNYLTGIINTFIYIFIYTLLLYYFYNIKIGKSIFMILLYSALLMIPDMIISVVSLSVIKVKPDFFYNNFVGTAIANFLVCFLLLCITKLLRKQLRKLVKYDLDANIKLIIYFILTLICTLVFFYYAFTNLKMNDQSYISVAMIIIFLVGLFSVYNQKIKNTKIQHQYEKLLEYMKQYEEQIEKQRILRHENKNQISSIKSLAVDSNASNKLLGYLNSLSKDNKNPFNKEKYAKFQYFPANGIKALFYFKTDEAEEKGINASISISPRVANSYLSQLTGNEFKDLGKIIGVYMDNAIEASENSEKKIIGIEAYLNNKNQTIIIISNSYSGKINEASLGNIQYSTKGKDRGHGLLLVDRIIKRNSRFEVKTEITNKLYIQKMTIKKPTNK